ncbi:hypothetical protein HJG60_011471 [Phyllostomus discolor]|uniref:Uncharacterized protein n=1 Tax=Phyllostomus discolor TaxID=89673 RepID=A0A834DXB9_9CHIR|nr:hypothetical protein HJG60_011471 [Phyllostomus discolor]
MRTLPGGALKKLAEFLTPAVLGGNIPCLSTFRTMHSSFSRDPMLLDDLLTRAIASTGGAWPDQVQEFDQPLHLPLSHLKQALVQVNFPTSQQLCEVQLLWVSLEYPEPKDATPEGEGPSVWEDDLGRGSSLAGVPLKAGAPFLSLKKIKEK